MKTFQDFLHIMDFNGNQAVQGPIYGLFLTIHSFYVIIWFSHYTASAILSKIHRKYAVELSAPISDNRQKQLYI